MAGKSAKRSARAAHAEAGASGGPWDVLNRVHAALASTLDRGRLCQALTASAVSDLGLGFDRAAIFLFDRAHGVLRGECAIGAKDAKTHRSIQDAVREERCGFDARLSGKASAQGRDDAGIEDAEWSRQVSELRESVFLIDVLQGFRSEHASDPAVGEIAIPVHESRPGGDERVWRSLDLERGSRARVSRDDALAPVLKWLGRPALVGILHTKRGPRGLFAADLSFGDPKAIPAEKKALFEWLLMQASLALENADLFGELETAYAQIRELDEIKGDFLSTLSHELLSPLTTVTGFTQLVLTGKAGEVNARQKDYLQRVFRQAQRLSSMVNDLLEIADASSHAKAVLNLEPVDPASALRQTLPRLEHRIQAKSVTVNSVGESRSPMVLANEDALERVFYHLLDNAIKFSPNEGRVRVTFRRLKKRLRITVADEGIGISDSQKQRIFEGFFQADNKMTRSYEGLGIGLTLTKKLLDAMGGVVSVESRLGEGSRFSVEFPTIDASGAGHAL